MAMTPGAPSRAGPQDNVESAWADPASAAAALQAPPPAEAVAERLPDDHPERVGARAPRAPRRALRCACSTAVKTRHGVLRRRAAACPVRRCQHAVVAGPILRPVMGRMSAFSATC